MGNDNITLLSIESALLEALAKGDKDKIIRLENVYKSLNIKSPNIEKLMPKAQVAKGHYNIQLDELEFLRLKKFVCQLSKDVTLQEQETFKTIAKKLENFS